MLTADQAETVRQWVEMDILLQHALKGAVLVGEVVRVVVGPTRQEQLVVISRASTDEPTREVELKRYPVQVP